MTKAINHQAYYTNQFANWSKALGPKPTSDELAVIHAFARPGKQALAGAMMLRADGCTSAQMKGASELFNGKNTPHRNKWVGSDGGQVMLGNFTREPVPGKYKITLAARGKKRVDELAKAATTAPAQVAAKAPAKAPSKPKGAPKVAKARAPKAKPVEATPVAPPVTNETPTGEQAQA